MAPVKEIRKTDIKKSTNSMEEKYKDKSIKAKLKQLKIDKGQLTISGISTTE
jgi:hypothetical protein